MEDQVRDSSHGSEPTTEKNEPVRSRWTPKPEQILILESIFNSGMVNPPKEETIKIRKLLEKFGSVGDANVFYWFQNRRSRSRRRQRQIQATLNSSNTTVGASFHHQYDQYYSNTAPMPFLSSSPMTSTCFPSQAPSSCLLGSSSNSSCSSPCRVDDVDGFPFMNGQVGGGGATEFEQASSIFPPSDGSNFHYQSGSIMVFINGVPTEVQRGPLDMKGMFGQDLVLVHSSGVLVPFNDHGFSVQGLQHGESYFLVSRQI